VAVDVWEVVLHPVPASETRELASSCRVLCVSAACHSSFINIKIPMLRPACSQVPVRTIDLVYLVCYVTLGRNADGSSCLAVLRTGWT
jgi:hypothetical protein